MKKTLIFGLFLLLPWVADAQKPLRLAVAGVSHGHVPWILNRKDKKDIELVGVAEPDKELSARYATRFKLDPKLFHTDLGRMLDEVKPEAVVAFGSIYQHLAVVEACAPRGIHVMVEKPLSYSLDQAKRMVELAEKHHIFLLTNYETSWYPSIEKAFQLVADSNFVGKLRKVVVHTGHEGPKEIGVGKEFFDWLTDPVQNGGGALIDFGCYGANLMTYFTKGEKPLSVTAITRQFKPEIYPKVDDEATIIVEYPSSQCIIQASWNWPFGRKDMEVYGDKGYIITDNNTDYRLRNRTQPERRAKVSKEALGVYDDPFAYFHDVIRRKIKLRPYDLYSPVNNLTAVQILDAARQSAKTGKTVTL